MDATTSAANVGAKRARTTRGARKLPFPDIFLVQLVNNQSVAIIIQWAEDQDVVDRLKQFKVYELDNAARYALLKNWLGVGCTGWPATASSVLDMSMQKSSINSHTQSAPEELQRGRVADIVRGIVANSQVPGHLDNGKQWAHEASYNLILTALADLQENPAGYFQKLLGGATVAPWSQTASSGDGAGSGPVVGASTAAAAGKKKKPAKRGVRSGKVWKKEHPTKAAKRLKVRPTLVQSLEDSDGDDDAVLSVSESSPVAPAEKPRKPVDVAGHLSQILGLPDDSIEEGSLGNVISERGPTLGADGFYSMPSEESDDSEADGDLPGSPLGDEHAELDEPQRADAILDVNLAPLDVDQLRELIEQLRERNLYQRETIDKNFRKIDDIGFQLKETRMVIKVFEKERAAEVKEMKLTAKEEKAALLAKHEKETAALKGKVKKLRADLKAATAKKSKKGKKARQVVSSDDELSESD